MEPTLRQVWEKLLDPADYDLHMSNVGQAEANGCLLGDLLAELPGGRLLIAGAGTGAMLDLVNPSFLLPFEVTFTDISERFLQVLRERLGRSGLRSFRVLQDDVEDTRLEAGFDVAAFVLVLEHVDWQRALEQAVGLGVGDILTITQENPSDEDRLASVHRELPGTVGEYADTPGSHLISIGELAAFMEALGFVRVRHLPVSVPDGKTMHGSHFQRQ